MDSILKFAANNQIILIIIAVILVLALIGYLTESKRFHDEDKAAQIRGVNQIDEKKVGGEELKTNAIDGVESVSTQEQAKLVEEEKSEVL